MEPARHWRGAGAGFLGVGIAFLAIASAGDKPAFMGVGLVFLALGIGGLFRGRSGPPR